MGDMRDNPNPNDPSKMPAQQFGGGDAGAVVDFFAFASTLHARMADPRYNESFGDAFDLFTNASGAGELTVSARARHRMALANRRV